MTYVVLPELGEGIETATVAFWHAKAGDTVSADQDVVEMVTDKATFNVSAGHAGILKKVLAKVGDEIKIGQPLAVIE
jgi:pyruvate/2-oxoglutarate dehydrogenase complex dihydrolipoamide acyltransferase (E2) component